MIDNLNEINRLIIAVHKLCDGQKGAERNAVIQFCRSQVIEAQFPNHNGTINFSKRYSIVHEIKDRIKLTKIGRDLLKLNPQQNYRLSEAQKDLFIKKCLLAEENNSPAIQILKQFSSAYSTGTYQWSASDDAPIAGNVNLLKLMIQSGLIIENGGVLEINKKLVKLVRNLRRSSQTLTPTELSERLKKQSIIGQIAEDIAWNFEIKRLEKIGCIIESKCIQKVCELDISAGYDIASYDGECVNLIPNRFIEVKGSSSQNIEFYWTRNEIMKAQLLGPKYWLYFFGEIDANKKDNDCKPVLIQDPVKEVLNNNNFDTNCVQFHVKMKQ